MNYTSTRGQSIDNHSRFIKKGFTKAPEGRTDTFWGYRRLWAAVLCDAIDIYLGNRIGFRGKGESDTPKRKKEVKVWLESQQCEDICEGMLGISYTAFLKTIYKATKSDSSRRILLERISNFRKEDGIGPSTEVIHWDDLNYEKARGSKIMGTRSLTVVKDYDSDELLVLYRQYDGYPSGHGKDLKDFLENASLTNGFGGDAHEYKRIFNGMPDLAIRLVTHLKNRQAAETRERGNRKEDGTVEKTEFPSTGEDCIGGYYMYPTGTRDAGEEWIYTIYTTDKETIRVKVQSGYRDMSLYYDGTFKDFNTDEKEEK